MKSFIAPGGGGRVLRLLSCALVLGLAASFAATPAMAQRGRDDHGRRGPPARHYVRPHPHYRRGPVYGGYGSSPGYYDYGGPPVVYAPAGPAPGLNLFLNFR